MSSPWHSWAMKAIFKHKKNQSNDVRSIHTPLQLPKRYKNNCYHCQSMFFFPIRTFLSLKSLWNDTYVCITLINSHLRIYVSHGSHVFTDIMCRTYSRTSRTRGIYHELPDLTYSRILHISHISYISHVSPYLAYLTYSCISSNVEKPKIGPKSNGRYFEVFLILMCILLDKLRFYIHDFLASVTIN